MEWNDLLETARNKERVGQNEEAIVFFEKAMQMDCGHRETILSLSRLYLITGKPIQSLQILLQSKKFEKDKDFLVQLSNTYMTLNQFDEAEKVLKEALDVKPESSLLNNLGVIAIRRNKGEEAIDYFTQSLQLDAGNLNTWFNLATFYESHSDFKKAKEVIENSLKKLDNRELKEKYAQLLSMTGENAKAIEMLEQEIMENPNELIYKVAKARVLFQSKQYDQCLDWIQDISESETIHPQLKQEFMEITEKCYFFKQDLNKSLEILDQLLLLSNGNPSYEFRKAYVLAVNKNYLEALKLLSQIVGRRNLPPQIFHESHLLMKGIEIENWKTLVQFFFTETQSKELLAQNLPYILETRHILLPEDAINFLQMVIKKYKSKQIGFNSESDIQ